MVDETEVRRDVVQVMGTPTDGQVPEWDAAQGEWVPATPAGGSVDVFKTIAVSGQSDVVADSSTDTLTLVAGSNVTITTDAATDSITIAATGSGGNAFGVIAVSGQANVEADAADDTLTLVAGSNVTITTNAATDTVTIAASTPAHASSHAEGGSDRITSLALANTGLTVRDTDDSHELTIAPGSNLTANRTLTVNTGDASRAVTITGTASIEGTNTGDQNTFKTIDVAGSDSIVAATAADTLTFVAGSNITITTDAPSNEVHIAAAGGVSDGDKGDITVSSSGATWTIDNDAVTNAKLANVATATIKGRSTAGTGDPEDLTGTQATALLDNFTSTTKGLVPLSGGGTTKFLRADATWSSATIADGDKGDITVSASGATWTIDAGVVTTTKMGGDVTTAGKALLDDATAADQRTTLGLGALATLATVGTSQIDNDAVTLAKVANIATDRLLGRDTAGSGDPEELTVGGGIEFTGSGGIQRSAVSGEVTIAAGSNTAQIQIPESHWIMCDDCFWASLPNQGWTQGSSGTGTSAASSSFGVDSTEKAQGVVAVSTGTDAGTGRSSFYQCLNSLLLGQGTAFEYEARVCMSALSTVSEEYVAHFGFIDNANSSSEPADSAAFVYRRTTDGDFWVCQTRSNSSETKTVTAIEPSTSAFAIFKIVVASDGASVKFYINGSEVASHSANIPTGSGRYTGIGQRIYKTAGSTARLMYFDWIRIKATGSAR